MSKRGSVPEDDHEPVCWAVTKPDCLGVPLSDGRGEWGWADWGTRKHWKLHLELNKNGIICQIIVSFLNGNQCHLGNGLPAFFPSIPRTNRKSLELFFILFICTYLCSFWGSAVEKSITIALIALIMWDWTQCFSNWLPSSINVLAPVCSGNWRY